MNTTNPPRPFTLEGTRRRLGAQGAPERFTAATVAASAEEAKEHARKTWADEWQDILFTYAA